MTEKVHNAVTRQSLDIPEVNEVDADNKRRAEEAGVSDAAYIDYDEALENYRARPDIGGVITTTVVPVAPDELEE